MEATRVKVDNNIINDTSSLSEAILQTDNYLRNFGLGDDNDLLGTPDRAVGPPVPEPTQAISQNSLFDLLKSFPDTGTKMDIDDCDLSTLLGESFGQPVLSQINTPVMSPIYEVTASDNHLALLPGLWQIGDHPPQVSSVEDNQKQANNQHQHHTSETSSSTSSCSSMSGQWTHTASGTASGPASGWTSNGGNSTPLGLPLINLPLGSRSGAQGVRQFSAGALDPIPENEMTETPRTFQPLVPPPIVPRPPPATSYNISFPTTLQPRDRFDIWRNPNNPTTSATQKSAILPVCHSSQANLNSHSGMMNFKGAFEHNVSLQASKKHSLHSPASQTNNRSNASSRGSSPSPSTTAKPSERARSYSKSNKRSRSNTPTHFDSHQEEQDDIGVSSRQRRKSNAGISQDAHPERHEEVVPLVSVTEIQPSSSAVRQRIPKRHSATSSPCLTKVPTSTSSDTGSAAGKRKDLLKVGLEALQRALPHVGPPEEEKMSQASVLYESAKFLRNAKKNLQRINEENMALKQKVDQLHAQIEACQGQLPENGASMLDHKAMENRKSLPEVFHDHVVKKTNEDWRYWVFTSIMGHFIHSFNQEVSAGNFDDLRDSSLDWVTFAMSLQQLRKDAFRKLAKISAKTSIVEDPSKLPEEALAFVQKPYLPPMPHKSQTD